MFSKLQKKVVFALNSGFESSLVVVVFVVPLILILSIHLLHFLLLLHLLSVGGAFRPKQRVDVSDDVANDNN